MTFGAHAKSARALLALRLSTIGAGLKPDAIQASAANTAISACVTSAPSSKSLLALAKYSGVAAKDVGRYFAYGASARLLSACHLYEAAN